jgi:hypothetical protein
MAGEVQQDEAWRRFLRDLTMERFRPTGETSAAAWRELERARTQWTEEEQEQHRQTVLHEVWEHPKTLD